MRSSDIPPIEIGVRSGEAPMRTEKPVSTWLNTLLVGGRYSVVGIVAPRFGGPQGVRGGANLVAESRRYFSADDPGVFPLPISTFPARAAAGTFP